MRIKVFLLILLYVFCSDNLPAQKNNKKISLTGIVLDGNKNPVVNGIVMIDNKKTSAVTDYEGKYKIKVKRDATRIGIVTFSNGYIEEEIGGRTLINLSFKALPLLNPHTRNFASGEDERNRGIQNSINYGYTGLYGRNVPYGEEAVEVGYATMKRKYITTDITYIDGTNKKYASYSSVYDMIQREVSGVRIMGGAVIIQGSANFFGSVGALVIVDGTYGSLDGISPSSVESISVLKGTAAAIYGSRGSGGAIIVKTKTFNEY